jgi:hypothetical protein
MVSDRIEIIYNAIDQMAKFHGKPRPVKFGGGKWNFDKEIKVWKEQIKKGEQLYGREPLTRLQWKIIDNYINIKKKGLKEVV